MASPNEKRLEKGCILPHQLVAEIAREDSVVLSSLARFCACTQQEIIKTLELRNVARGDARVSANGKTEIKRVLYGYRYYDKKKGKGKTRTICTPEITLGRIQATLKERFASIPVSLSATGGKPGDSDVHDADLHRNHPYLLSMDIKDAYPSIDTHRVYKNLQGAMLKLLEIQVPLLKTPHEKDLFIRAITHLCVWQNQLPQGAATSTQLQNIVMASFDAKVEETLPELVGSHMIYSRYVDDMSISFPHFKTQEVLEEKLLGYKKSLADILMQSTPGDEQLDQREEQFLHDTFVITDNFELNYLTQQIKQLEKIVWEKEYLFSEYAFTALIGKLHTYKQRIRHSDWHMKGYIRDEMLKIMTAQGRHANNTKTKIWTPQSGTAREIHGLTYTHDGKRGINKKDKSTYIRLFKDLATVDAPKQLEKNLYYKNKFGASNFPHGDEISVEKVIRVIDGIYGRCKQVYGATTVPKSLQEPYLLARNKRVGFALDKKIIVQQVSDDGHIQHDIPDDLPF